ncbi:MAG: DEAD/DEAH box helicase, partial [Prevotellaceae bacterium]|nr:DEAD/DEAH box helicase [Prevotellaceae bacterium]
NRYIGFYLDFSAPAQLRDCLYSLLHAPEEYAGYESGILRSMTSEKLSLYAKLIQLKEYEDKLCLINADLISNAASLYVNDKMNELAPLSEINRTIERIRQVCKDTKVADLFNAAEVAFLSGSFQKAAELTAPGDDILAMQFAATDQMARGNVSEAFAAFEKSIKMLRKLNRNLLTPSTVHVAFFYFAALMSVGHQKAIPIFQKMEQKMSKNNTSVLAFFAIVTFHMLNMKSREAQEAESLSNHFRYRTNQSDYLLLIAILTCYMAGQRLPPSASELIFSVTAKAHEGGYTILAYEAAYAMKSWFGDARSSELLRKIALSLSYQPVLSRIAHQEEWEKSLNMLLGMKTAAARPAKDGESKVRVTYFFNPSNASIQPVLQTRQAKGWSTGRNIALKSFYEGKTKGMTDQDLRVAKTIKSFRNYYEESYDFTEATYQQLVGHPYIFLENSANIPVEFVAAQPVIQVTKSAKGYTLSTDVRNIAEPISLQKETNTRYRVYSLTPQQMQILRIVTQQSLVVPEHGKDKLVELLGVFSGQRISVHSDLLTPEGAQAQVKEVPADSRIRVQLLPLGDGLKAELFAKPFGAHPPYCKPGKGGRALIANENSTQLQVKRDIQKELENESILLNEIQALESLDMTDDLITFSDPLDSLSLLDMLAKHKDISVVEWPEGERLRIRGAAGFGNLNLRLKSEAGWFDLQGELKVDEDTVVSLQQLLALTAQSRHRFVELSPGEFLALSSELKKQLDELRLFSTIGKNEVKVNRLASIALTDFFDGTAHLKADKSWQEFRERVGKVQQAPVAVPGSLTAELRAYQEEGFRWLARLAEWGGGACLADDMGLGKTVQALAMLLHRAQQGPAMVVCPVSVISGWANEAARFAPTLQVKIFGNAASRKELLQSLEPCDLLIISYGLLQSENELLSEPSFATVVLDEAHAIKNYATKTSKATMQLKADFRVALTGTPIQNHLGEIWNIFNFINPGLLGSLQRFTDTFIKPDDAKARKYLKKLIAPFILRRTKTSVLEELPPKTEIVKKIQLSGEEQAFYEALRRQAVEKLSGSDASSGAKHIQALAEITKLRQASCHPQLIDANIQIPSSKLSAFLEIVGELRENKHRALVFSQFVSHLAIVRKSLDREGVSYQYLDGSTPAAERERSVKRFQSGEGELFLISLKAGGLGLNLTAADFVIHLDPWWNPAVEDQASDRAHRIGQTRPVTIYRLVAENTIEEKIIRLHHTKRDLAESLLEGSDTSARLSLNELIALIKDTQEAD